MKLLYLWNHTRGAIAILSLCVLVGCAALEIDVDVYKGPLANEQEIQLRQFAALAIAAKPLLAAFRNDLEAAAARNHGGGLSPKLSKDFLDDYADSEDIDFKSNFARFVNGSLLYYVDLAPPHIVDVLQRWEQVKAASRRFTYSEADFRLGSSLLPVAGSPRPNQKALARAYAGILCGAVDDGSTCLPLSEALVRGTEPFASACEGLHRKDLCPENEGANSVFNLLATEKVVRQHARILFDDPNPDNGFVQRVLAIANAFLEARKSMQMMFEASLVVLDDEEASKQAGHAAGRRSVPPIGPVLARALQPRTFACLVSPAAMDMSDRMTLALLGPRGSEGWLKNDEVWTKGKFIEANQAVADAATVAPGALAKLLRKTHLAALTLDPNGAAFCPHAQSKDAVHVTRTHSLQYGISAGPAEMDLRKLLEAIDPVVANLKGHTGGSFDKARLPEGLETLTKVFLETLDSRGHNLDDQDVKVARLRLEEALIFFAERMLVVVNTMTDTSIREELGLAPAASRSGEYIDVSGPNGTEDTTPIRIGNKMAVLQTLGNSLLLHANDLERRRKNEERLKSGGAAEFAAARRAQNPGADVLYDMILLQARSDLTRQQRVVSSAAAAASSAEGIASSKAVSADDAKKVADQADTDYRAKVEEYAPIQQLIRTIVPKAQRGGLYQSAVGNKSANDDAEKADQAAFFKAETAGLGTQTTTTGTAYLASLKEWLGVESGGPSRTGTRDARLKGAVKFVDDNEEALARAAPNAVSNDEVSSAIRDLLLRWARGTDEELATLSAKLKTAKDAADKTLALADAAKTKKASADQKAAKNVPLVQDKDKVLGVMDAARADVLDQARRAGSVDARTLIVLIRQTVADRRAKALAAPKDDKKAAPAEVDTKAFDLTVAFLEKFDGPATPNFVDSTQKTVSTLEVFDQVIAQLRQSRIQAESIGAKAAAQNISRALNAAYEARSGAAFLRPSSDYLRNVYSSTNLQDVQGVQGNMLTDWFKQAFTTPKPGEQSTIESRLLVEKLYWQNINRITLAGGGKTNYVLAKDDVGNWYVKAYTTDPSQIIRSAQSLALFGAGRRINVDLLRRVNLQRSLDTEKDPNARAQIADQLKQTSPDSGTALSKVRDKYAAQYIVSLQKTAQALRQVSDATPDDVSRSIASTVTDVNVESVKTILIDKRKAALDGAIADLKTKAALDPASTTDWLQQNEDAIVTALEAFRRYRQATFEGIASADATAFPTQDKRSSAAATTQKYLKEKLTPIVSTHRAAVDTFQGALVNIGDVSGS